MSFFFFFLILTVGENYPSHYSTHDRTMPLFKTINFGHDGGDALFNVIILFAVLLFTGLLFKHNQT